MKTFIHAGLLCASILLGGMSMAQTLSPAAATDTAIPSAASSAPDPAHALPRDMLLEALRKGGYVVYFRHTATDFSRSDEGMKDFSDCAHQRLLSAQGRSMALKIGQQIRALNLPVGEVLASPYCRTMDTARLAFSRAEPRNDVRENEGGDYIGLKRLLAAPVASGTNRWIVGHGNPFRSVAGPPHLAEGEAAVIKPQGTGWTVVARVLPDEWSALRKQR